MNKPVSSVEQALAAAQYQQVAELTAPVAAVPDGELVLQVRGLTKRFEEGRLKRWPSSAPQAPAKAPCCT